MSRTFNLNINSILLYLWAIKALLLCIGRKGIEPLTANAIEFTAQPVIPTNGIFLLTYNLKSHIRIELI